MYRLTESNAVATSKYKSDFNLYFKLLMEKRKDIKKNKLNNSSKKNIASEKLFFFKSIYKESIIRKKSNDPR